MRHLRILIFVHFIVFVSPVNANPEISQAAEKFIYLSNVLTLRIMPAESKNFEIYTSFCSSSGFNKIIDDVRVLLSELQHRTTRQDFSVKSLFVMNLPKLVTPELPIAFYEFSANMNLKITREISLDQFCLKNSGKSESELYNELKILLLKVKVVLHGSDQLKSLCKDLSLCDQYSELTEALDRIK